MEENILIISNYYFPEMDAVGLNYQNAGYLSTLILKNIGGILAIFAGQILLIAFHILLCLISFLVP